MRDFTAYTHGRAVGRVRVSDPAASAGGLMGHRGLINGNSDFDAKSLEGKPSTVGFLGVPPAISPRAALVIALFLAVVAGLAGALRAFS